METETNQAEVVTNDPEETKWAMFGHLSSFLGLIGVPFGNLIAPLIIWQVKKDQLEFAASQAKECLNFQISVTIYSLVAAMLCLVLIGIPILFAIIIADIVLTIIAAVKSNQGVGYKYPLTIRFIK